ncbi:hypothetical protein [Haloarcula halophila]|uniref:hypothetical protein n=1 Tax=Halomicroarcula sp. GCM10025335 TaxID=3252668 RepID=UPI00360C4241
MIYLKSIQRILWLAYGNHTQTSEYREMAEIIIQRLHQNGSAEPEYEARSDPPSEAKQRELIERIFEENEFPYVALSTLEHRLPYECSRPTIKTRLEELAAENKIRDKPFNPHADKPTRLYYRNVDGTEWMAPPDAELLTDHERQILDAVSAEDGSLPEEFPRNTRLLTNEEQRILDNLRDDDGDLPDSRYVRQPYEDIVLDTSIGDCFYQGPSVFGDLVVGGLLISAVSYLAYHANGILPISRSLIGWVLLVAIVATLLGCLGILASAGNRAIKEVAA